MSLADIQKCLRDNPVILPPGKQDTTVIVVSDSKGSYLEGQIQNVQPERSIIWKSIGGSTSQQTTDYILRNVKNLKKKFQQTFNSNLEWDM